MEMQKSNLTCADARHLVHLAVGDDTLPEEDRLLTEHLHGCSDCRSYHAGMVDAMHAIEQVRDDDSAEIPAGAVWAAISHKVKTRRKVSVAPERRRFNGAVAALCACSLSLALVTVIQNLPMNSQDTAGIYSPLPVVNVNYQPQQPTQQSQAQQNQLVPMQTPEGRVVWVNPRTGQAFVPNILASLPDDKDTSF